MTAVTAPRPAATRRSSGGPGRPASIARAILFGLLLPACSTVSPGPGAGPEGPDPVAITASIEEGEAHIEAGRYLDAVTTLLSVSDNAPAELRARALVGIRSATDGLSAAELDAVLASISPGLRLQTPLLARQAARLAESGALGDARTLAERILAFGAEEPEAEVARGILAGDRGPSPEAASILGAILPEDAVPALRDYGAAIRDGVGIALAFATGMDLELAVYDDQGVADAADDAIVALQERQPFGIIGPLFDGPLAAAAAARTTPVPIISPTARVLPAGAAGVYTLSGPDTGDARLIGEFAAGRGFRRVVTVYPNNAEGRLEAEAFRDALLQGGGTAPQEIALDPDTAFFRDPIDQIRSYRPDAIALLLSEAQVTTFAPQYTFYGLDSLDIPRLGGAAWGIENVVRTVATRHTDGVIAAVPTSPLGQGEAYNEFVQRYEDTYQRGLPSATPALGYDAALLLIEAAIRAERRPDRAIEALESIEGLRGATGVLSVRDGRIVREHQLVRIDNRTLVPIGG